MVKNRSWARLAFILVLLAGIIGAPLLNDPYEKCIETERAAAPAAQPQKDVRSFDIPFSQSCLGEFMHTNAEAIIAAFTVILGLATLFLWWATRDLVNGSDDTARRQLRAYVHPGAKGPFIQNFKTNPCAQIVFKNYGKTPAHKVRVSIMAKVISEEDDRIEMARDEEQVEVVVLAPKAKYPMLFHVQEDIVTHEARESINLGKAALCIFGRVTYSDAFQEPRFTNFCFLYRKLKWATIEPTPHGERMSLCPRGNYTDEDED